MTRAQLPESAMSITITCGCGNRLLVSPTQAGTAVRCPACTAAVPVPAMGIALGASTTQERPAIVGQRRPVWPWVATGMAAVLALAVVTLLMINHGTGKKPRLFVGDDPDVALVDDLDEPSPKPSEREP